MNLYKDSYRFSNIFKYNINSIFIIINYGIILRVYVSNINNVISRVFSREEDSELRIFSSIILELYKIRLVYLYID